MSSKLMESDHSKWRINEKEIIAENKVLIVWSISTLLVVMNTTMFNVALPYVLTDFSLSSSTASWLVSGYSIMFAISTMSYSRLSDFVPMDRLLTVGITILFLASIVGFFANSFIVLLTARSIQAAGAGAVTGLGIIMAGKYFPLSRRGKAMAVIASSASLAFGLGPVVSGIIIQYLGWNYLFIVTGLSVLSIPFFRRLLPEESGKEGNFDLFGAILTAFVAISFLLYFTTFSFVLLFISIIILLGTIIYINKVEAPFLPPILFMQLPYMKIILIGSILFFINFANLFLLPILLSLVHKMEPLFIGFVIFPGAALAMALSHYIGKFIDLIGGSRVIFMGLMLLFGATIAFSLFATIHFSYILIIYMFASIGFTAASSAVSNEITIILPEELIGSGIAVSQLFQFFGGGLGATVSGLMLTFQHMDIGANIYQLIFGIYACIIFIAIIIYYFYNRRRNKIKSV